MGAELFRLRDFGFGIGLTRDHDVAFCTAARGEFRQSVECGDGVAEMIEKIAEGDGTDVFAAGETEAGKPLRGGEHRRHADQPSAVSSAFFWPMRGSVPESRRPILPRCAM